MKVICKEEGIVSFCYYFDFFNEENEDNSFKNLNSIRVSPGENLHEKWYGEEKKGDIRDSLKGAVRLKNVSCVPINCIKEVTESLDSSFDQSNMLIIKKMDRDSVTQKLKLQSEFYHEKIYIWNKLLKKIDIIHLFKVTGLLEKITLIFRREAPSICQLAFQDLVPSFIGRKYIHKWSR